MKLNNILGWLFILGIWWFVSWAQLINSHVLPSPAKTVDGFTSMITEHHLFSNILFSLKINFAGYIESVVGALLFGFVLASFKTTREMFAQPIDSLRFIPITAFGGVFVALSGLTIWTKIHFLAFGIWVYLVPVVVQRVKEVSDVHLQMMQTLGATKWQVFKYVIWPYVISRLSDDIRILVGISWTYIIVAELKNVQGGVGSLIWLGDRQSNVGIVYAAVITIVIVGMLQDFLFKQGDKQAFKFKHV